MKIDEKVICYYESSDSPVDKEGYLYKKGEIKTSYQKRWFVLKGNLLFYKDKPLDRDLIGVIVLEGCTVQLCESDEQFAFSLLWSEPGLRTYKLAAEDQESLEDWIKALLSANHCYLAIVLSDMERAYREALGAASSETKSNPFIMPQFPVAARQTLPLSTSTLHRPAPSAPGQSSGSMLQPSAVAPTKATLRKSPKLRPKKAANTLSTQATATFFADLAGLTLESQEDFRKMHEEFGKEIKKLISLWAKRRPDGQEDLIDFD
ncbi:unnamed protein product [Knipowitschia caucasica]